MKLFPVVITDEKFYDDLRNLLVKTKEVIMPLFILICLLSCCSAAAQSIVLVDKAFREPFTLAAEGDAHLNPRFLPVYTQDIDSVMSITAWYIEMLEAKEPGLDLSQIKKAGASKFIGQRTVKGGVHQFRLNLVTLCGQAGYSLQLVENEDGHKKRLQKLRAFYDYLRNNRFLVLPSK